MGAWIPDTTAALRPIQGAFAPRLNHLWLLQHSYLVDLALGFPSSRIVVHLFCAVHAAHRRPLKRDWLDLLPTSGKPLFSIDLGSLGVTSLKKIIAESRT